MKLIDIFLFPLIPTIILIHLLLAPYTKVEESFNIQATHDIAKYGLPTKDIPRQLRQNYDHFQFPGAVPRTFIGAFALASISNPIIGFFGTRHAQLIVRGVLGLFNSVALLRYKYGLGKAFGENVGRWYVLLQASQFHVMYYASRTLPNMFAFGMTTLALCELLPAPQATDVTLRKKQKLAIFLLVFSGIVFRSEISILLLTHVGSLLLQSTPLHMIIGAGVKSAALSLAISVPVDSFFWQKPIWPELAGFYYNAIEGKSSDWGTSPVTYYFSSLLPRLLLNPLILILLLPMALVLPSTKYVTKHLVAPSVLFITVYSLQPHKESRFIIYVVPPLTAAASLAASYIWTRRRKSIIYLIGSGVLLASVLGSFAASSGMLFISSLNYPGGEALSRFHQIIYKATWTDNPQKNHSVLVHMDVLSCMTGVNRFQQLGSVQTTNGSQTFVDYDKTEDENLLLTPEFWERFDYALMEMPARAIGKWDVVDTIHGYAGMEFLRPGDGSSFGENLEIVYAANNLTTDKNGHQAVPDREDVKKAVQGSPSLDSAVNQMTEEDSRVKQLKARLLLEELGAFGTYKLMRDGLRLVTGGWWIGPKLEPAIRILRRVKDPAPS